jgi:hypothetical protein
MIIRILSLSLAVSILITACSPAAGLGSTPVRTTLPQPTSQIIETPVPTPSPIQGDEPSALDSKQLLQMLSGGEKQDTEAALEQILALGDKRFVSVLIELMRAAQIGLVRGVDYQSLVGALEDLSGQEWGEDWPAWVEWYGGTDLLPPQGFTSWKGELLSKIDPEFKTFLQDDNPSRIRVEEIQWGGVIVDGIPALNNPLMIPAEEASYLGSSEAVFGIALNGDSRAYPLRIMDWHEMANDVVGGVPVSLAYCTLCGAGIVFDGRASDGQTYTFGSSGFLYRSNKLMFDRQTRTLWNQLTGEPVLGECQIGWNSIRKLRCLPWKLVTNACMSPARPMGITFLLATRCFLSGSAVMNCPQRRVFMRSILTVYQRRMLSTNWLKNRW